MKFLLLISLNHLITLIVLYHSFTLNLLTNSVFIWSNRCLLILSISLLDEFMNLVLGCYRVIRELPVPFILILSNAFAGFDNFFINFCSNVFICFFIGCCDGTSQKVLIIVLIQSVHIGCLVRGSYCFL